MIMNNELVFTYNGMPITFNKGDGVMVNATEMAKAFGRSPNHWIRNTQSQEFIQAYCGLRNRKADDLIKIQNGGSNFGTWMHEDVALEFARWLSPAFAIWCNDRIKELMRYGMTALPNKLDELLDNPDLVIGLATQLKKEREEKSRIAAERRQLQYENDSLKPKAAFADAVSASNASILIGDFAKILKQNGLDIGQNRLFQWLRQNGYLMGCAGDRYNMPTQRAMDAKLFEIKESLIKGSDGRDIISRTPKLTGKGQLHLCKILLPNPVSGTTI